MKMSENARIVFDYLKSIGDANVTATDIGEAVGLARASVDAIVTSAFQKKGLMQRTPAEIQLEDGTHKSVKFISLTEAGLALDPDAPAETKEA